MYGRIPDCLTRFQSTGPLRDPTTSGSAVIPAALDFNPQVPCGTRRARSVWTFLTGLFQSTGPLRDPTPSVPWISSPSIFQSTGPLRDPTFRTGSLDSLQADFNPQVPCGTRQVRPCTSTVYFLFQSTGPLRDPTFKFVSSVQRAFYFNPQVPCGTRHADVQPAESTRYFNPQVPCGTRPVSVRRPAHIKEFQSTGPLRDPTSALRADQAKYAISIHRSLAGPDSLRREEIRSR